MLSWAGKEILIKAVAQAIPTFAMGCFEITKGLCDQISSMICRYWWNQQEGKHKIHWLSWEKMIKPKMNEEWDLETYTLSIWQCLLNKVGD